MPIAKHHTKKGSHKEWKVRAYKFKEVQKSSLANSGHTKINNSLLKPFNWVSNQKKKGNKNKALTKLLSKMFRRGEK